MKGKHRAAALLAAVLLFATGVFAGVPPEPHTAPRVDLARLEGTWYEIARLPARFVPEGFVPRMAIRRSGPGEIEVEYRCRKGSAQGPEESLRKKGRILDEGTNARIRLKANWLVSAELWVLEVGEGYGYAVVGTPDRRYLWILSRDPGMGEDLYREILAGLREQAYDTARLVTAPGSLRGPADLAAGPSRPRTALDDAL
jgi:apolipoprotein D and lipocalin family protein